MFTNLAEATGTSNLGIGLVSTYMKLAHAQTILEETS